MNGEQDSTPRITEAMLELTTIAGFLALIFALFFLLSAVQDAGM